LSCAQTPKPSHSSRVHGRPSSLHGTPAGPAQRLKTSAQSQRRDRPRRELGQPELSDDYDLWIYDESTPTPHILYAERVTHGATCNGTPCWDRRSNGDPRYRDGNGENGAIRLILTEAGGPQQSRVRMRADGPGLPALPLPFPLRLQLHAGQTCIEAGFFDAQHNDARRVRARSD
jgi:hypothetical protein